MIGGMRLIFSTASICKKALLEISSTVSFFQKILKFEIAARTEKESQNGGKRSKEASSNPNSWFRLWKISGRLASLFDWLFLLLKRFPRFLEDLSNLTTNVFLNVYYFFFLSLCDFLHFLGNQTEVINSVQFENETVSPRLEMCRSINVSEV